MEYQSEQVLIGTLQNISESLENIDKTLSEPKNISAHRIAANRRISNAMDYVVKATMSNSSIILSNEAPMEVTDALQHSNDVLDKIREILLSRE